MNCQLKPVEGNVRPAIRRTVRIATDNVSRGAETDCELRRKNDVFVVNRHDHSNPAQQLFILSTASPDGSAAACGTSQMTVCSTAAADSPCHALRQASHNRERATLVLAVFNRYH